MLSIIILVLLLLLLLLLRLVLVPLRSLFASSCSMARWLLVAAGLCAAMAPASAGLALPHAAAAGPFFFFFFID